jgi:HAE1 family hydrophobic/amphiphilic exporter-1
VGTPSLWKTERVHGLAKLSLANRALIALITISIAFFGALLMTNLKQELIPSISLPQVSIITTYQGASPEVVDEDVSQPVESALQGLQGLETTSTTSTDGQSVVSASFEFGTDIVYAEQRIQQALNRIDAQLPDDAEWNVLSGSIDDLPVVQLAFTGGGSADLADRVEQLAVPDLRGLDGVRAADLSGDRPQRITIAPDLEALAANGLTPQDITDTLDDAGVLVPAGTLTEGDETLTVQAGDLLGSVDDLRETPMPVSSDSDGTQPDPAAPAAPAEPVTLGDVAEVTQESAPVTSISRVNGEDALTVSVTKRPSANTVEVSQAVAEALPAIEAALGDDVDVTVTLDQAPFIQQSIDTLITEGLLGLAFAVLVIFFFLFSVRATLITAISIPTSLLVTFIALTFLDYSLNVLTLGALTIAIGRVVDDSIVVVENIRRHLTMRPSASLRGGERARIIVEAVREVGMAITASTLVTVAVFLPVIFVGDVTGELFRPFGLTSAVALLASLFVSLTIVPVLAYWFLGGARVRAAKKADAVREDAVAEVPSDAPADASADASPATGKHAIITPESAAAEAEAKRALLVADDASAASDSASEPDAPEAEEPRNWLQKAYEPLLRGIIRRPAWVLVGAVVVLIGTVALVPLMKTNFLGSAGQNTFAMTQEVAPNASLESKTEHAERVEQVLEGTDGIEIVQVNYGGGGLESLFLGGSNTITWSITTDENADADAIQQQLRDEFEQRDDVGEIEIGASAGFSTDVTVRVAAPDAETLTDASDAVVPALEGVEGVQQVTSSVDETRPFVELNIDATEAAKYGLNEVAIGGQVAQALQPVPVGSIMIDGTSLQLYFVGSGEAPTSVDELRELPIPVGAGTVPLSDLADVEVVDGPAAITSTSGTPYTELTIVSDNDDLGGLSGDITEALDGVELPGGATVELSGSAADQQEAFEQLGLALLAAILVVYIVMVATLKSLLQPLLLLVSVPFAATGAIALQVGTGIPLGVASLIGVLMLIGIVVTNAIVLVDLVNQYRRRGDDVPAATFAGSTRRVRPIVMTALATILALTPMALGITGHGGFISQPMAVVVIGGLFSSTLLTLVVLPALYVLVEGRRERRARRRAERHEARLREAGRA